MEINWKEDYQGEFMCPDCQTFGIKVRGIHKLKNKRQFACPNCSKTFSESCQINIRAVKDPRYPSIVWYTNHVYQEFICTECQTRSICLAHLERNKKRFRCRNCRKLQYDSIELIPNNISHYGKQERPIQSFLFDDDKWDLRAINPNFDKRDDGKYIADFNSIKPQWLKDKVKRYIDYLCKSGQANTLGTIQAYLSALRCFSRYITKIKVTSFEQINRSSILDYLSQQKKITKNKLCGLRSFFIVGNLRGWFTIDPDMIRDEDYPKRRNGNPEPLSNVVREQIEQNLHKLPDPIARMWIICFFAAMRPSELALLQKECLVQEGQHWKLVWQRKKTKDYHEIPISRTIAKVVQEQQEYINELWGENWDFLFCHYHNCFQVPFFPVELEPIQKVIPTQRNPLVTCINNLIKSENILDENGKLAKFTSKLLRTTRLTQLFEQGHDLAVVSAWAGHKHWATTSTYYTEVSCELIEREVGHIQQALVNAEGHKIAYESFPKSFWENPQAHRLELAGTHINTPIYGYCGLNLDEDCDKFRACYTCSNFVAIPEKLPQYIKVRDELRGKEAKAFANGQDVLIEQFSRQADQLDKIIASLQEVA